MSNNNMAFQHAQADNDSLRNHIAGLEAENARLQAQLVEAVEHLRDYREALKDAKALAERRGEALEEVRGWIDPD